MKNIAIKVDGSSQVDSSELNSGWSEEKNAVLDAGQTLSASDDFQVSKAMSVNAAGADYYEDSSHPATPNNYVLSKPGTSSLRSPPAYFEGQKIRFRPDQPNDNTVSPDIIVAGVAVVPILKEDGVSVIDVGDLQPTRDAECRYDIGAGAFLLKAATPEATKTSRGILFLGDQRIILSNNGVDPNNDIDFSGGRWTFDDGTGESVASALTKQIDATFVAGNNQGMLDTGVKAINSTYHTFTIKNPTTGVVDYLASLSPTAPTMPAGFTKKRLNGSILTDGSANIIPFLQVKNTFFFKAIIDDVTATSTPTVSTDYEISAPAGRKTEAIINFIWRSSATILGGRAIIVSDPDGTDQPPVFNTLATLSGAKDSPQEIMDICSQLRVMTDTSSQIAVRATTSADQFSVVTVGWVDHDIEVF